MGRFFLLVLDSVGIGALPDAADYGDAGANTLANIAEAVGGLQLPHLQALGLGNIASIKGVAPAASPKAAWGKMAEVSPGKDTTTGHWELMGVPLEEPFPTYTSFPPEVISPFEAAIGRSVLGNTTASGTEIIEELGTKHMQTGSPIVYTSADSVFQIAAHEDVVSVEQLYDWCQIARGLLKEPHHAARVIARPFTGEPGAFTRTPQRRDFSLPPPETSVLEELQGHDVRVHAIGKIKEIFSGKGIDSTAAAKNNDETLAAVVAAMQTINEPALVFANCVDFDSLWGHRNDVQGYAQGLAVFDSWLPKLLGGLKPTDVLCLTADHGCDPTTTSTDHSREYVPVLVSGCTVAPTAIGVRSSFADLGQTVGQFFAISSDRPGRGFWTMIQKGG